MRTRYIQDHITGEIYNAEDGPKIPRPSGPMIMGDIQPYKSMVDGTIITSRSKHRAHLREHNCTEVGNELKYISKQKQVYDGEGRKQAVIDAVKRNRGF